MVLRNVNTDEWINNPNFSSEIGGKAKGLLFLKKHGFQTPPFYLLDYEVLSGFQSGKTDLDELLKSVIPAFSEESERLWAVRSSVDVEDGETRSFAGYFRTEVNVPTNRLVQAVKLVLNSYAKLKDSDEGNQKETKFGIVIQEMIRSEYSGVVFSHHPENVKDETCHINVIPGLGENLVSGREEGFLITHAKGRFRFHYPEALYSGEIYTDKLEKIEKKGEEILRHITGYLPSLVKGTKRLAKLKAGPVDIE
jgi:phosphoenolpyruvate synthase/pyruvate phosphate dikinase